ncbi:trifunctional histidinol dehydrogenase [Sorochytrium milnesiophthora]
MLLPLFDIAQAIATDPAAARDALTAEIKTCQMVGPVLLSYCRDDNDHSTDAPAAAAIAQELCTQFPGRCCVVVPVSAVSETADLLVSAATKLLDAGADKVVLQHPPANASASRAALVDAVKQLPGDRVLVQLQVSDETCSNEKDIIDQVLLLNNAGVAGYMLVWPTSVSPFEDGSATTNGASPAIASSGSSPMLSPKIQFVRQVILTALKHIITAVKKEATDAVNGESGELSTESTAAAAQPLDEPVLASNRSLTLSLPLVPASVSLVGQLDRLGVGLLVQSTALNLKDPKAAGSSALDLGKCLASVLTSDRPDGLFPTVVVDEQGVALGLVYSSIESLSECIRTGTGVYHSRTRGLWYKGLTSGATQELIRLDTDCDRDTLRCMVRQHGPGFCHLGSRTCFGRAHGLTALASTLQRRRQQLSTASVSPSYTHRLFTDQALLNAKILEEAKELVDTPMSNGDEVAWETADVIYFALVKAFASGLSLVDVEKQLDRRACKVTRRKGDAKPATTVTDPVAPAPTADPTSESLRMQEYKLSDLDEAARKRLLQRPIIDSSKIMSIVKPIIDDVRQNGDKAVLSYTAKFDRVTNLASPVLLPPFTRYFTTETTAAADSTAENTLSNVLLPNVKEAIDTAYNNIHTFHAAQLEQEPLHVTTMPGITCSRYARPVERVGIYVPGGTAVLPSSTMMLGVPAKVAGCREIVVATPPRRDGTVAPEVLYVADKVGASQVVVAGGAQAVAAMAYGTESVHKVDKICGPGNQFVTAAKMLCQNDTSALLSIDMPAGPSEVLVIADATADPVFVAADLLSQAEHGADSQVVLVLISPPDAPADAALARIQEQVEKQALALPRVDIVRKSIAHSYIVQVPNVDEALAFSNAYAPEHLILNLADAEQCVNRVQHAGSIFVGPWSPESCGDYASGTNHTLPTYGYARIHSGVSTSTFLKYVTAQTLTEEGLRGIADCVVTLANVEGLHAHARAVSLRVGTKSQ